MSGPRHSTRRNSAGLHRRSRPGIHAVEARHRPNTGTCGLRDPAEPQHPGRAAAVEAEIRDLLLREASPGGQEWERAAYDDLRPPHTIPLTHVTEAIRTAAGETDHVVVAPGTNVVANPFELLVPGTFTFGDL